MTIAKTNLIQYLISGLDEKASITRLAKFEEWELTLVSDHDENEYNAVIGGFSQAEEIKNGQATYIAPLQPSTLATFRSWGTSTGAGRIRLAHGAKIVRIYLNFKAKNRYIV